MPVTQILRATGCLLLLGCALNLHAEVYKSIGADGQTVYSDKPAKGATKLQPVELNVTKALKVAPKTTTSTGSQPPGSTNNDPGSMGPRDMNSMYPQFVESAEHDTALVNPAGAILVSLSTGPDEGLPEGFTAQIQIDGEVVSSGPSTLLSVPTPHRGTHIMEAQILDRSGQVQVRSNAVTFHVIKSTVR